MNSDGKDDFSNSDDEAINDGNIEDDDAKEEAARNRWMQLEKKVTKGKQTRYSLPFIEDKNNHKDIFLIQQILINQPHLAHHGQVQKAWEHVGAILQDKEFNGAKVFGQNLNYRTLQSRFVKYCNLVASWRSRSLRMTGVDDELSHERWNTLEYLYDQNEDFKNQIKCNKDKTEGEKKGIIMQQ
jgi:hypothetical protein